MSTIDKDLLDRMISEGFISRQEHRHGKLSIYNYTAKAQYGREWNEATLQCRGLILNNENGVVARPFSKFFNVEEMESLPNEPFSVFAKMDGSLGILYFSDGQPYIATRGSFDSAQARKATGMLYTKYAHCKDQLRQDRTYLFEIIYPANRIVLDYGDKEELVLLAVIDTATGKNLSIFEHGVLGFPLVEQIDYCTSLSRIDELKAINADNEEGYVLLFESGVRAKLKFAEYVRLHKIITQCSNKSLWEYLQTGRSIEDILDRVPDEFYSWVRNTVDDLNEQYLAIELECQSVFKDLGERSATAEYFKTQKYPAILFRMLDKRDYSNIIWKAIKPDFAKPFKTVE